MSVPTISATRRVIVGFDASATGLNALWCAAREARRRDATLFVVVVEPTRRPTPRMPLPPPSEELLRHEARVAVSDALLLAVGDVAPELDVRVAVVHGSPARELSRLADRRDDVLVVADRSHQGWRRLVPSAGGAYSQVSGTVLRVTDATTPVLA